MHSFDIMTDACHQAIAAEEAGENWHHTYAEVVDPQSALELIAIAQAQEDAEARISDEELAALAKLVRDLTGYIKFTATKPNPVRDDLLLQATQLLNLAGL
ncbi:MAG: hypothetical protein NVSMB6_12710 [Burkholderiaceae bacterium]